MKWKKLIFLKSNPRDFAYMERLFAEQYPEATVVDATRDADWACSIRDAKQVVLLYPDSIGLGFKPIEEQVLSLAPGAEIQVLSGRRRSFTFDSATSSALRWRRLLSYTMFPEFCMTVVFLIWTPVLLIVDLARGKR